MRAFLLALTLLLVPMALAQGEVVAQVGPEAITREAFELRYGLFVRSALAQLGLPDTEEARALLAAYRPAFLEALAREKALLQRAREEGLYPDPAAVEARVHALKEAFPEAELYADANESLPPKEAERYLLAWKELGLRYVEEPLPVEEVEARRALREKGILSLIADDAAMTPKDLKRELALNTFDVLNLKPARTGVTWTLEMLALARERGKKAMVGSQAQSAFGAYQSALLAFQQGVTEPCELAFHLKAEGGFFPFPPFREGWLYWEDLVEARFDEEAFARYALKEA